MKKAGWSPFVKVSIARLRASAVTEESTKVQLMERGKGGL